MNKKIEKVFAALKKHKDIRVGFADIDLWTDTGVYSLNRKLSNTYNKGFLYGRTVAIYGEPGSGKSLLLAQTAANEQKNGTLVVWIDVEGAVSDLKEGTKWFNQVGLDTDNNFERLHVSTFRNALKTVSEFVNLWREDEETKELPPLMLIFDSYSNLQTDSIIEQNKGKKELTQDMGQKARQLGDFLVRVTGMIEGLRILVTGVMHVYMSQEEYGPRHKITGGVKALFTASQAIILTKFDLTNEKASAHNRQSDDKDDAKSNIGIRSVAQIIKSRYSKPFEKVELEVVYPYGIDPYSGLFDMFVEDKTIVSPTQGWYEFTRLDGSKSPKFRRAEFLKYADELMTLPIPERKMNRDEDPVDIFEEDVEAPQPQEVE
jgi:RecA/RadA recombinase